MIWSSGGIFIKLLTFNNLSPFQISFWRSLIAGLTILSISLIRKQKIKFEFDIISILCSISFAGILFFFVLGTTYTTVANIIFLQFTAPLYLIFLEPFFLKVKFKIKNLITIIICISGMALFFAGKFDLTNTTGNIIGILSGISFAFFSLFIKWKKKLHLSVNTVFNIMAGNFILSAICLPFAIGNLILNPIQLLMLLYLGIFQIGISYMIFNEGIKYVSATESLIFAMLETVFNPFWVFLGIGEVPSQYALAGGVIIITAILMHNFILQEKTN